MRGLSSYTMKFLGLSFLLLFKKEKHLLEPWNLSHDFSVMALATLSTILLSGEQTFIPSSALQC